MRSSIFHLWAAVLALGLLAACSKSSSNNNLDGGGTVPPDVCNSIAEALDGGQCALALGQQHLDYITTEGDRDWFSVQLPAGLTARSLVHVVAGYQVPNTPVDLSVNLLKADGQTSLAHGADQHGQGSPKPVELIVPYAGSGEKLLLLLQDEGLNPAHPYFDVHNPYGVTVTVDTDPDVNEPNDLTPTPIALTSGGAGLTGSAQGTLSTPNDVDQFKFTVPSGRKVIYLHITAPQLNPPPTYRLEYTLFDPTGTPVSEGVVANAFLAVDLATARLNKAGAGDYKLVIDGYKAQGVTTVPGDLRQQYTVNVEVLDDLDTHEPNDSMTDADGAATSLSVGSQVTVQGRIGYVPDPDWFAFDLPTNNQPSLLHYKLTPPSGAGRFPPLPGLVDRQVQVFTVTDTASCNSNATDGDCPKGYDGDNSLVPFVTSFCSGNAQPLCLRSYRLEDPQYSGLRNFEGVLPVAPHSGTQRWYVVVGDQGTNWADDAQYTLTVESLSDPDETTRYGGGTTEQTPDLGTLADDSAGGSFPTPSSATVLSGVISHGYGRMFQNDWALGQGIRGPKDYDAVPSDSDTFQIEMPTVGAPPLDRTWELQWSVGKLPDGGLPYGLSIGVEFCDGFDGGAGTCSPVSTDPSGNPLVLAYHGDPFSSWYNINTSQSNRQPLYDFDAGVGLVTARAYGCFCFEPRFVAGGKFFLTVGGVDRNDYTAQPYQVRTAWTSYPKSYVDTAGNTQSCPAPVALSDGGYDPGCQFTGG